MMRSRSCALKAPQSSVSIDRMSIAYPRSGGGYHRARSGVRTGSRLRVSDRVMRFRAGFPTTERRLLNDGHRTGRGTDQLLRNASKQKAGHARESPLADD